MRKEVFKQSRVYLSLSTSQKKSLSEYIYEESHIVTNKEILMSLISTSLVRLNLHFDLQISPKLEVKSSKGKALIPQILFYLYTSSLYASIQILSFSNENDEIHRMYEENQKKKHHGFFGKISYIFLFVYSFINI